MIKQIKEAGYKKVIKAISSGLLKIEPFLDTHSLIMDRGGDMTIKSYFDSISQILTTPQSFPLLDSFSVQIAQALVKDGVIPESYLDNERGKEIHLATQIMHLAPTFPRADVWDIIDIRKELRHPLVRFRGSVMKLSALVNEPVYGKDFVVAAQDLIRREINPSLLDVNERIEANRYLKRLTRATSAQAATAFVTGLTLLAGTSFGLPGAISALIAGAGALATSPKIVATAVEEFWKVQEDKESIEQHDLYFVARLNEALPS